MSTNLLRRVYCWPSGTVLEAQPDGSCPECGEYGRGHREVTGDECGSFAGGGEHGHPCEYPIGHDGPCACPDGVRRCGALHDTNGIGVG